MGRAGPDLKMPHWSARAIFSCPKPAISGQNGQAFRAKIGRGLKIDEKVIFILPKAKRIGSDPIAGQKFLPKPAQKSERARLEFISSTILGGKF